MILPTRKNPTCVPPTELSHHNAIQDHKQDQSIDEGKLNPSDTPTKPLGWILSNSLMHNNLYYID